LSKELASLVHHVELSREGWRERALELIAVAVLKDHDGSCRRDELEDLLNSRLPSPLGRAQIEHLARRLESQDILIELGDGTLRLSEATLQRAEEQSRQAAALEARVQAKFEQRFGAEFTKLGITWTSFEKGFLTPLVSELGAHTYEFLAGKPAEIDEAGAFIGFVRSVPETDRPGLSQAISEFLDHRDPDVRTYVLRLLNACFLVQATAIPESVLKAVVQRTSGRQLRLNVVVDTNFLFSLLGLHENPADDVVKALGALMGAVKTNLDVKLYMLPITVDEARRTLGVFESNLTGLVLDKDLARSVREKVTNLSGITLKFIKEALTSRKRLSSKEYFQPYLDDFLSIARSKGVELYNEPADQLRTAQSVVDDVLRQIEIEKKRAKPGARVKPYEAILHDMVLWHFVARKRPARIDSPLDASFWVATIDFAFLGFDRYKQKKAGGGVPVCVHPTVLLQILQLWVPQSDVLEAALVASLQPYLPHVFDPKVEQVTVRILRAISRFEDAGDLSSDTIARILFNQALRARIVTTKEIDEQIEMVREVILEETQRLDLRAQQLEAEAQGLKTEIHRRDREVQTLKAELQGAQHVNRTEREELQGRLVEEQGRNQQLAKRLGNLETELQQLAANRTAGARRRRLAWSIAGLGLLFGTVAVALEELVLGALAYPSWIEHAAVSAVVVGGFLLSCEWLCRVMGITTGRGFAILKKTRFVWWSLIGSVLLSLFGSAVWDAVSQGASTR
jgi:hypothetical protein